MANQHSKLQLWTIKNFGTVEYFKMPEHPDNNTVVNVGPMGVGKTYVLMEAFGIYLLKLRELGYKNLNFILIGRTLNSIKKNMTNELGRLFLAFHLFHDCLPLAALITDEQQ
mgnify:CR=1 FL=1